MADGGDKVLIKVQALLCGTCNYAFERELDLRRHQEEPGDGDKHDGEPWATRTFRVGERYIWEPTKPRHREAVEITAMKENADGEVWIESAGIKGRFWNELARFHEATVVPAPWDHPSMERDLEGAAARFTEAFLDALRLIARLRDPDPCRYDHEDLCQAHGLDPKPCPHEKATTFLKIHGMLDV